MNIQVVKGSFVRGGGGVETPKGVVEAQTHIPKCKKRVKIDKIIHSSITHHK